MVNRVLIITSGGSQLLTQITVIKNEMNINEVEIFILYNGVFRQSLEVYFNEVALFYRCKYLGQINFDISPEQIEIKNLLKDLRYKKFWNLNHFIESKFPELKNLRKMDILIIPIRVKMFSDIVLLSFLKPKKTLYTVDGIVDELPERNFNKLNFFYLKSNLKKLPLNSSVFSPIYLENDCNRIGMCKVIDLSPILKELTVLSIVKKLKEKYLLTKVDYIIFSQHYSLSENVNFDNEIEFYKRIITKVCVLKVNTRILFKPHPRDTKEKIDAIKKSDVNNVVVIDDFFQSVPVEFFIDEFIMMNSIFITGNSSAPLCFQNKDKILSVFSSELLSESLNLKITDFAIFNNLKLIEI